MTGRRATYYVLVGRTPIAVEMRTWSEAFEKRHKGNTDPWRVANDEINDHCHVSTVFLGLDHNWTGTGDPILFETLVFGGPLDGEMMRYRTFSEAERGHAKLAAETKLACEKIKAIADAVGAGGAKT